LTETTTAVEHTQHRNVTHLARELHAAVTLDLSCLKRLRESTSCETRTTVTLVQQLSL